MASTAGLKLRRAREGQRPSVSQYKLAASLGVTRSRIASYEGQVAEPPPEIIEEVSRMWGIPVAWFWDGEDSPLPERRPSKGAPSSDLSEARPTLAAPDLPMPFRGYLPADEGWDEDDSEDFPEMEMPSFLGRKDLGEPERVVMRVKNGSMEPRLFDGDLVVVVEDHTPRPGRLVVARSGKRRTVKVLRRASPFRYALESINPEHGEAVAKEWEIVGYVVAVLHDYAKGRGTIEWDEGGLTP